MSRGRRAYGEGSVYRRADGRYVASIRYTDAEGRKKRREVYATTRRDCLDKLHLLQRRLDESAGVLPDRLTLAQWLSTWTQQILPNTVRPSTAANYRMLVRRYIVPSLGHRVLSDLRPADVRAFLSRLRQTPARDGHPLAPRTLQYIHAVLRRSLTDAMREELISRNVAALVAAPRVPYREVKYLTPDQARTLLEAARQDRLYALYAVALAVGLRRGEALALHWDDVDLTHGTLRVRGSLQRVDGELHITEPKTARSRRLVPLPDVCTAALAEHQVNQQAERAAARVWVDDTLVFATRVGTPIEPRNLVRSFHTLCEGAGLPRIRFHDLRHTCASLLLAQGVEPRVIMETLGHSVIGTTMNLYAHVLPATQRAAATQMDRLLTLDVTTLAVRLAVNPPERSDDDDSKQAL